MRARLPARLFDAHAHVYRTVDLGTPVPPLTVGGPAVAGAAEWRHHVERLTGEATLDGGLLFPFPVAGGDIVRANSFLIEQLRAAPDCRGLLLAAPGMERTALKALLEQPGVVGFKPYHVFSRTTPTFDAPIGDYCPEWMWQEANERGGIVMLHLVRTAALADERNQRDLRALAQSHPRVKLVLAHAARGFHAPNTARGLTALRGLDNIWFDASGICQPSALIAILREFGPRRLMWGSDFPVSERRGTCVTIGDGFAWIRPERCDEFPTAPAVNPWPVGLENLRALLDAADEVGLNRDDLEDVFRCNAMRLTGRLAQSERQTQDMYARAKERIPGGAHLLSKRPEMFAPDQWPAYFREARGCEVWGLDGRHFYDFSINAVGACLLGYRDPDVTRAVRRRLEMGAMCSQNPPEEVELADRLCTIHPWAEQVRLARTGGELAAVAVRIARATTDRPLVAICGYHGWADWYLAANLGDSNNLRGHLLPGLDPLGVPQQLRGTVFPFTYNNREELQAIFNQHGDRLAAVVMEPCRSQDPDPGFLEFVRDGAHRCGALLIFDEITIGWRLHHGGAHLRLGVHPDMALFAKALGNGHPIAAVIGTKQAMQGAHASFISSAYWTESIGPVAALATLDKMEQVHAQDYVAKIGARIQEVLRRAALKHGLPLKVSGYPCATLLAFEHAQAQALKTLYVQEMLAEGILAGGVIYATLGHNADNVARFAEAWERVGPKLAEAIAAGNIESRLRGPVAHAGFRRLI
jgi:glutamate-1-semialdehyde 2,1-aminomutase